ncbi:MAG TPA: glycerol-3-phosphate 1-O-acyltransferase PlsY [Tepidisphaeraceae bacterium]|jgi:glycerol-3-phosphate acyltransferase PlsY|nr:glycerol-3-phosphate 1-O-acyltransferase PlsY [Tepidisphaeraceae bacterium]
MTTPQTELLALVPVAYVAGSVPFGLIVGLAKGVDPRKAGSGNIGATNLGRLLGGKFFAITFVLDLLKGLLPVLAAGAVLRFHAPDQTSYFLWLLVGFSTIFGHMFSLFLKFKGGKGVATSTGVVLGIFPYYTAAGVVALAIFVLVFKLTRYVSVASMVGAVSFTLAYLTLGLSLRWDVFGRQLPLLLFALLVASMIVFKHRGNIARLRAGTEHRFGAKAG